MIEDWAATQPHKPTLDVAALELMEMGLTVMTTMAGMYTDSFSGIRVQHVEDDKDVGMTVTLDGQDYPIQMLEIQASGVVNVAVPALSEQLWLQIRPDGAFDLLSRKPYTVT